MNSQGAVSVFCEDASAAAHISERDSPDRPHEQRIYSPQHHLRFPRYRLGGPATGFPAFGSGMTLCPLSHA
jgi:hypothetical protein